MKKILIAILFLSAKQGITTGQNTQLWGMTPECGMYSGGTIFKINDDGTGFTNVFHFSTPAGYAPQGNLILASDGKLYGTCLYGGAFGSCTIFSYDPVTGIYNDVHSFNPLPDGDFPYSGLAEAPNGVLYGVTNTGGLHGFGTIYSFDPATGIYTNMYDFISTSPYNTPIIYNNKLYGTIPGGGVNYKGAIFSFDLLSNTFADLYDFDNINGSGPVGILLNDNGVFYATAGGGNNNAGVIYSFNPSTNVFQKLFDLDVGTGAIPKAGLMKAGNGKLYGTAEFGGANTVGAIFSFDPVNNSYTDVYDFVPSTGYGCIANLIQAPNGKLYGTNELGCAAGGGSFCSGVVFSYDILTNTYTDLEDFTGPNGGNPNGGLIAIISTGISQLNSGYGQLIAYPNPVSNVLHLSMEPSGYDKIIISDHSCRTVMTLSFATEIDFSLLEKGIYFIELLKKDNIVACEKISHF
jgi:uncharacterized repeat protein (TIGR03803 family)